MTEYLIAFLESKHTQEYLNMMIAFYTLIAYFIKYYSTSQDNVLQKKILCGVHGVKWMIFLEVPL